MNTDRKITELIGEYIGNIEVNQLHIMAFEGALKEMYLYGRTSALDEVEKELHSQQITYRFSPPYTESDFKRESIAESIKTQRAEVMKISPQLTLGELIAKLEAIPKREEGKEEADVTFDFEYAFPTTLESWRGIYEELAIGFRFEGYELGDYEKEVKPWTLSAFIEHLKSALGKTYEGWKGGDFMMGKTTPIWVANPGNVGETGVLDVHDDGYRVRIITGICKS